MLDKKDFGKKLEKILSTFLRSFKDWVEDFENLALRKKNYASVSIKFLERLAKSLITAFDELLLATEETYDDLYLENSALSDLEKKQETQKKLIQFKSDVILLIQRANVKAKVLLSDFQVSPFSPEITKRLEQISKFTWEDFIKSLDKPEE